MEGEARWHWLPELTVDSVVVTAAAGAAALLGAVAVSSPKIALLALMGAAFVAVAMTRLPLALAGLIVVTFPEHLPGSFGAGATLAKPVGALLLVAWAGAVLTRRGDLPLLPRAQPLLFCAIVGLLLLGTLSTLWAPAPGETQSALGRLVLVVGLTVVTYTAASTRSGFRTVIYGYLVASVVTSLYSIINGTYSAAGRLSGLFDPNFFAAELIPAIVIACFLFVTTGSARTRLLVAGVAAVDLVAFVLTQSRGGIVGLAVALLAALVFAGRARPRLLALLLVLVAVACGYYLGYKPAHVFGSSVHTGGLSAASSGRTDEWRVALRVIRGHPVGGVGLGNYRVVEPAIATQTLNLGFVHYIVTFRQLAHNTYLQMAAELGLLGLALFLFILLFPIHAGAAALPGLERAPPEIEFQARGLVAGAIGMLAAYLFLSADLEKPIWLVLGLLACIPALLREDDPEWQAQPADDDSLLGLTR